MSIIARNNGWSLTWRFEGKQKWLATKCRTKTEAQRLERECLTALDAKNFSFVSEDARQILIRLHKMMNWAVPAELVQARQERQEPAQNGNGLILWKKDDPKMGAIQRFLADDMVKQRGESAVDRYSQCFYHLIRVLGAKTPVGDIWVPELRKYYAKRTKEGAAPNTIGRELSTLSILFRFLIADRKSGIKENPCKLIRGKDNKEFCFDSRKRQSYLSLENVEFILSAFNQKTERSVIPEWLKPVILCGYYTGMRLNEILKLKRKQVFLGKRMIYLSDQTVIKEREVKRIPIHKELHPILEKCLHVDGSGYDNVFFISDEKGTRPIKKDSVESAFRRMFKVFNPDPRFSFHDLRHTFRANGARSGISDRILERILGHSDKEGRLDGHLPVNHRYGAISDKEFIDAIDHLTFDHGDSEINGQPLVLNPVSYLLAETKKRDAVKIDIPLSS